MILEKVIERLGAGYSRLSPRACVYFLPANLFALLILWASLDLILFCSCDVISLIIQAIGGGMAATAVSDDTDPEKVYQDLSFR